MRRVVWFFLKYKEIIFVLLIAFLAGLSLLHPGLIPTHDGEYHVIRFYEFDKVLRSGILYPRWAPDLNNGFGVPLFNYVYPFPNYFAFLLHLFGVSFISAVSLNMFFATLIGSLFMYLWSKEHWGEAGAIVSSVFYSFSPYRFVDIYIRGSVGEVWALAFFPALLWSYYCFRKTKKTKFLIASSIFLALLIYSHNILAIMFFTFFILYASLLFFQRKETFFSFVQLGVIVLLGLGLSAPFWIPALFEKSFVTGLEVFDVRQNFAQLYELLIPSWGTGYSGVQSTDKMSFQIGIANLLAVFFVIVSLFKNCKKSNTDKYTIIFFITSFFAVVFLMLSFSSLIWEHMPFLPYFQFPWRFLSLEILIASFLAGSLFKRFDYSKHFQQIIFAATILAVILLGINYARPAYYHMRSDEYYASRHNFIDGTNSVGNAFNTKWLSKIPDKEKNKLVFVTGSGSVHALNSKTTNYSFNINALANSKMMFNNAYFPGWKVIIDNHEVPIKIVDGIISFNVEGGTHKIDITLVNTSLQIFSYLCFLLSVGALFFLRKTSFFGIIK